MIHHTNKTSPIFFRDEKEVAGTKISNYDLFLQDLFEARYPHFYKKGPCKEFEDFKKELLAEKAENRGVWVYYPWLKTAYLCPPEQIFFEIFTSRNKTLVTDFEQQKFYNFRIGIIGLSVGQSAAITIVRSGGGKNIKIADADTVSPSNLNRLHTGIPSIGRLKTESVAEKLYEVNPYLNIKCYNDGISNTNLEKFINDDFKLDAVIDAADDIEIKIALRKAARKQRIPVLMATDVGSGALIDIERFDLDGQKAIFNGRIKEDAKPASREEFIKLGLSIISPENLSLPLIKAMREVGKTIPTHPQLGISAYFTGVVMAYVVRRLSTGGDFPSERIYISLEDYLNPEISTKEYKTESSKAIEELKQMLGI